MPRLEQTQNGNYIVRGHISKSNAHVTWQVTGKGVTYLNQHGIYAGYKFEKYLLFELIEQKLVFTSASGVHPQKDLSSVSSKPKSVAPTKNFKTAAPQRSNTPLRQNYQSPPSQNVRVPFPVKKILPDLESQESLPDRKRRQQQKRGTFS